MVGRRACQRQQWTLLRTVAIVVTLLVTAFAGFLGTRGDPSSSEVIDFEDIPSWNPNVSCGASLVTIEYILGTAYPGQNASGAPYEMNYSNPEGGPHGGIPHPRALYPPCTLTNTSGVTLSSFVQVNNIALMTYYKQKNECNTTYAPINGGAPYPNNVTLCDDQGEFKAVGVNTTAFMQLEIEKDWLAEGWCGPGVAVCDNVTLGEWKAQNLSLDIQGFVYWDGENWEIKPTTGIRLSEGFEVLVNPTSAQMTRNWQIAKNVQVLGASSDPVGLSVSGCPANTVCGLTTTSGSPAFNSTLTVDTGPFSLDGTFDVTIIGTNATLTRTATLTLTIAARATASFQKGDGGAFGETDDTYLYSGDPNGTFGTNSTLLVDAEICLAVGTMCRSLLKFPSIVGPTPGQIPANSTIVKATLELRVVNKGVTQDLYQVTESWSESTASWNSFATPGFPENSGLKMTFTPDQEGWLILNITSIVQSWTNGETNEGILLTSTHWDGVDYNSSEALGDRPKLTVQYAPPWNGVVLGYDMETLESDGAMKDMSGDGRHGTMTGTTDIAGEVDRARHFNAGERIMAPAISVPATDFTVAAWFNWTTNPSPHYSGIHGGNGSWELRILSNGRFGATFYQSTTVWTEIVSPLAYNDGTWHHAAAVLRSGLVELYVDGVLVAQDTSAPISSVRMSTQTILGQVASDFVGDIDEVRGYARALTSQGIADLAPPPPADGPVLSYDMETLLPSGNMEDLSEHGRHGTLSGTANVAGKVGRARHFTEGDRITAPAIQVPAADFTIAAWFNWTTNPSPHYSGIHGGNSSWELRILSNGRFGATFYQSTTVWTEIVSPLAYNDGTWHHAAAVLRSGLVELYADGMLVAQDTTGPLATVRASTQTVGGNVASNFVGDIDEVRVYSRALTAAEVSALAPPRTDGLVLSYDMESLAEDGKMKDLSESGRHGTITGTGDVAGRVGRARHFTAGDRITAPAIQVPAADFTIAAWFNWTTNPSPHYSGIHGGGGSWELRVLSNGGFGATCYQSPVAWTEIVSPLTHNDGTWHHVAAVLRSGLVELYVDGVLVAQDTTNPLGQNVLSTQTVLGHVASDFVGDIDEVRVYSRALTAAEVANLASA